MARPAWTELGSAEPQPVRSDVRPAHRAPAMRLRRHQRPVLGVLDAAATMLQRHAREVLLGPALLLVPVALLNVLVSNVVYEDVASFDDVVVSLPEFVGGVDSATGAETLLAYVTILTGSLSVALAGGYLTVLVLRSANALPVSVAVCMRGAVRRLPALAGAWAVGHAWMVVGSLALVRLSTGDVAALLVLLLLAVLLLVTCTALVSPIVVAERAGPLRALRRSVRLVRARFGMVLSFVILSSLLGVALRIAITWLPHLVEQSGLVSFGRSTWLVEGIAGQLAPLIVVPWIALATANLYVQARIDAEGMDLIVESEQVFA